MNDVAQLREIDIETLQLIDRMTWKLGYAPTLQELGDELGLHKGPTHARITKLKKLRLVSWVPKQARTLRIMPKGKKWLSSLALDGVKYWRL